MSHEEEALKALKFAVDKFYDAPVRERWTRIGQVEATLYVGEQLERIADMISGGFAYGLMTDYGYAIRPDQVPK